MTQPPNHQPGWWQPPGPPRPQWQQGHPARPQPGTPPHGQHPGFGFQQPTSAYGGFGAFGEAAPVQRKRSKKPWIIGAVLLLVLAGGGVATWQLGAFKGEVLDQGSVQDGVLKVLRESFGESDVRDARCPDDQPTKTGTTFECSVTVAGQQKKVPIRVLNDKPEFEVGAPR